MIHRTNDSRAHMDLKTVAFRKVSFPSADMDVLGLEKSLKYLAKYDTYSTEYSIPVLVLYPGPVRRETFP